MESELQLLKLRRKIADLASLNCQQKEEYYKDDWRTWQMSDHFPLWVELSIDFSDEYLERVQKDLIKAAGG